MTFNIRKYVISVTIRSPDKKAKFIASRPILWTVFKLAQPFSAYLIGVERSPSIAPAY